MWTADLAGIFSAAVVLSCLVGILVGVWSQSRSTRVWRDRCYLLSSEVMQQMDEIAFLKAQGSLGKSVSFLRRNQMPAERQPPPGSDLY